MSDQNSNGYEGLKKMLRNPVYAGKTILKDMLPVKQSTVILDFAKPLLEKINMSDKPILEKTINTAVEVWNYCIVIDRACNSSPVENKRLQKMAFAAAIRAKLTSRISEKNYYMLLKRKEEIYPNNHYFIIEHNVRWSNDNSEFSLSVITNDASNIDIISENSSA